MALDAGVLTITVEFAKDLADKDWFGKQDPYCVITVGSQTARTRTHVDGGRNPVWNETFNFSVVNDNTVHLTLYDEDLVSKDDWIGSADISCAKARELGRDQVQTPVKVKGNKQKGFVSVRLTFAPNKPQQAYPQAGYPQQNPYAQPTVPYQAAGYPPQPGYAYPPPQSYPSGQYAPPPQLPPAQQPSGYYPSIPTSQPQAYGYPPQGGYPQAPPPGAQPYR